MEYVTRELFHLVGRRNPMDESRNAETLRAILQASCVSSAPSDSSWGPQEVQINMDSRLKNGDLVVPRIVCFCDIPFEALGIHIGKYGHFGLSLNRDHLVRHAARPVMYFPHDPADVCGFSGDVLDELQATFVSVHRNTPGGATSRTTGTEDVDRGRIMDAVHSILVKYLAFLKPFNPSMRDDHPNNYYMEREWRRLGNVRFEPHHVETVVVPSAFVDEFESEFPQYKDKIRSSDKRA